jgi:hypothetical protein
MGKVKILSCNQCFFWERISKTQLNIHGSFVAIHGSSEIFTKNINKTKQKPQLHAKKLEISQTKYNFL